MFEFLKKWLVIWPAGMWEFVVVPAFEEGWNVLSDHTQRRLTYLGCGIAGFVMPGAIKWAWGFLAQKTGSQPITQLQAFLMFLLAFTLLIFWRTKLCNDLCHVFTGVCLLAGSILWMIFGGLALLIPYLAACALAMPRDRREQIFEKPVFAPIEWVLSRYFIGRTSGAGGP
jgi:hypothetical protein